MKVIFLDNDGVICLGSNWGGRSKKWDKYRKRHPECLSEADAPVEYRFDNFDVKAVKVINDIIKATDAEIVVSSDWRKEATLEELGDYYISKGLLKRPIGVTKFIDECDDDYFLGGYYNVYEQDRCLEIRQYLIDHPEITHWVAIDDLDLGNQSWVPTSSIWGLENFVRCTSIAQGVKKSGLKEKIIKFLE